MPAAADENIGSFSAEEIQTVLQSGLEAVRAEEWDKAAAKFRSVVDDNPAQQHAVFYLGYSLHGAGKYAQAIEAHERASRFPRYTKTALYNWSCALALQGKKTQAIAKLKEAVDKGFVHQVDLVADSDMASLIGDEEFEKLRRRAMPFSQREIYDQFDFLLGEWREFSDDGTYVGKGNVTRPDGSMLLTEQWQGSDGSRVTGMSVYDVEKKKWTRTCGNSAGMAVSYEGGLVGNTMRLSGRAFHSDGTSVYQRLSLSRGQNGTVLKTVEESTDGGIEWNEIFSGIYRRPASRRFPE